jgi:competence protein ComEC
MFVLMTRAEPSVLRAAMMAGAAAVCFAFGWTQRTLAILMLSAAVLLVVDPMLLWSVGFWLSVGATAGLAVLAAPLSRRLVLWRVPRVLVGPLSTTLAAQVGTLVPMVVVFGRFSAVGIVTNLLAVPVAGAVMLVGLPVCFVAGLAGDGAGAILTLPVMAGVRWVWWIAVLGQRLS